MSLRLLIVAVWCWSSLAASARDIYVDNVAGNDGFTGSQPRNLADTTGPVRSIAKALRLASPGDRIILTKNTEPYREALTISGARHSGIPQQPLVLEGNGATLDGSLAVPAKDWTFFRDNIFRFRPPAMGSHQQLFLDGQPATRIATGRLGAAVPKLAAGQWCLREGEIYFGVDEAKLPADYALSYAALPAGILLYQVEHVGITDLSIERFQLDGIQATSGARNIYLASVTCRGNGRAGVSVGGAAQIDLRSCTLDHNGFAQLLTLPYSEAHLHQSHLSHETAAAWIDQGGTVYLGARQVTGGLESISPQDELAKPPGAAAARSSPP